MNETLMEEQTEFCNIHKLAPYYRSRAFASKVGINPLVTASSPIFFLVEKFQKAAIVPNLDALHEDLFQKKTWKILGLTQKQLIKRAAIAGGSIGVAADIAAHGISFGLFTGIGSLLGAGSAFMLGERITKSKKAGSLLAGFQLEVGSRKNIQFPFILLDRALIYYAYIINWAHGRRDYGSETLPAEKTQAGFVAKWTSQQKKICQRRKHVLKWLYHCWSTILTKQHGHKRSGDLYCWRREKLNRPGNCWRRLEKHLVH